MRKVVVRAAVSKPPNRRDKDWYYAIVFESRVVACQQAGDCGAKGSVGCIKKPVQDQKGQDKSHK